LKPVELSKENQQDALREIKEYFREDRDEEISDFQAQNFLDFLLNRIGPSIYNQAITDAHAILIDKIDDLYGLEKRILPNTQTAKKSFTA
jgi:uncharacterized protein (DUF2164 family)